MNRMSIKERGHHRRMTIPDLRPGASDPLMIAAVEASMKDPLPTTLTAKYPSTRVLLAEDNLLNQKLIKSMLTNMNYEVLLPL